MNTETRRPSVCLHPPGEILPLSEKQGSHNSRNMGKPLSLTYSLGQRDPFFYIFDSSKNLDCSIESIGYLERYQIYSYSISQAVFGDVLSCNNDTFQNDPNKLHDLQGQRWTATHMTSENLTEGFFFLIKFFTFHKKIPHSLVAGPSSLSLIFFISIPVHLCQKSSHLIPFIKYPDSPPTHESGWTWGSAWNPPASKTCDLRGGNSQWVCGWSVTAAAIPYVVFIVRYLQVRSLICTRRL